MFGTEQMQSYLLAKFVLLLCPAKKHLLEPNCKHKQLPQEHEEMEPLALNCSRQTEWDNPVEWPSPSDKTRVSGNFERRNHLRANVQSGVVMEVTGSSLSLAVVKNKKQNTK